MSQMLTKVEINNIDVSSYLKSYVAERESGKAIGNVKLMFSQSLDTLVTLDSFLTVEIWRGWTTSTDEKIFSGKVANWNKQGLSREITAYDKI